MATPTTTRRNAPRNKNLGPVLVAIAVGVVLVVVAAIAFGACSGDDNDTPAAGSTGAKSSARALLTKAISEMKSGELGQAKEDLEQVSKLDPQNKYAYYNLGFIAQTQKENATAESQYKLALAIDPKYNPALYNLAILRTAADDTDGAITLYQKAIAANAQDANAHFNLGLLLIQTGQTAAGNAQVQTAVQLKPDLASAAAAQGVPAR